MKLLYLIILSGFCLGLCLFHWPKPALIITGLILTQLAIACWILKK